MEMQNGLPSQDTERGVPSGTLPGVDRFAHFVVYRRLDGQLDCLGGGGMGLTYRAYDSRLERPVALKVINPTLVDNAHVRSRFSREARAAARLQHPHIASVLYQGEEGAACFYVMELVPGEDLEQYIHRVGPLAPLHAMRLGQQICQALAAAWRHDILHRDLKPGNVMLTTYDSVMPHVKVIDFGMAKILSEAPASHVTGGFIGTPEFASPEQCEERELDCRTDIYALGATIWYMMAGAPMFSGSLLSVARAQISTPPPFHALPETPAPALALLSRFLAKDREDRPRDPVEASRELDTAITALSTDSSAFTPMESATAIHKALPGAYATPPAVITTGRTSGPSAVAPAAQKPRSRIPEILIGSGLLLVAGIGTLLWIGNTGGDRTSQQPISQNSNGVNASDQYSPQRAQGPQAGAAGASGSQAVADGPPIALDPERQANPVLTFANSLGMEFADVPDAGAFVAVNETRLSDYAAYMRATGNIATSDEQPNWQSPGFPQTADHPVVFVSWRDAVAFCEWLTLADRKAGLITNNQYYRLPTRPEWDAATGHLPPGIRVAGTASDRRPLAGGGPPSGATQQNPAQSTEGRPPMDRPTGSGVLPGPPSGQRGPPFLWLSHSWPPPAGSGNFADESASAILGADRIIKAYNDGVAHTAPVGSFGRNQTGIADLPGNVAEIIQDGSVNAPDLGITGGSWASSSPDELRSHTISPLDPDTRESSIGFRCVLTK
jgi:serine/threonine protein kinase